MLGFAAVLMSISLPITAQNRVLAEIPIELDRNKTIVPVMVGSSGPFRLILDTGMAYDGILLFDSARVDVTQFDELMPVQVGGAGSGSASQALSDPAETISVGPLELEGQRVTILTGSGFRGFPTDGVIGYSLLGHYAVEIDHDDNRMILYEPSTFAADNGWESIDVYFKNNRIPWIDISLATGDEDPVRLSVYIDCASSEALELLERETNRFTLPEELEEKNAGRGLSGDIRGKEGRVSTVVLGTHVLSDVAAIVVPAAARSRRDGADAIVGNNLLRRFNVIFDYAHDKIHVRPNRNRFQPFQ